MTRQTLLSTFLFAAVLSPVALYGDSCLPPRPRSAELAVLQLRVESFHGENVIEGFDPNVLSYDAVFPESANVGVLWVRAKDWRATVEVLYDGELVSRSVAELEVPVGTSELVIDVSSGPYAQTYQVSIQRGTVTPGSEFALVFQENYSPPELSLFLSGPVATSGEVSIGAGFTESFTVTPGEVTTVTLPTGSEITANDVIEPNAAVHVTSEAPIAVYGLNQLEFTTDAFAGLPATSLGQRHRVMAWRGGINGPSQFAIAAIPGPDDDPTATTTVTITPSANGGTRFAGVPYTIEMDPFDAYQLQSAGDLTGTLIQSSRPVAVFGGNQCANIPITCLPGTPPPPCTAFCDHLVEQIPPVATWGTEVLTVPLAGRSFGDTFRIIADQDGTEVQLDGAVHESFTLGAGEFVDRILEGSYRMSSDRPILVAQYSNGTEWDGATADPFMMLIPSVGQLLDSYTFATPGMGFPENYANIVALTTDAMAGNVLLDGVPVPPGSFTALTGTAYSATQAEIAAGSHTLSAPNPVGLYVYGYGSFDSYGYPGGF